MADHARIFLSPDVVDFDQRIEVSLNGKKLTPTGGMVLPSLRLLLEDVRTRADRQHPFWAVFDSSAPGKVDEDWIIPVPDPENKSK